MEPLDLITQFKTNKMKYDDGYIWEESSAGWTKCCDHVDITIKKHSDVRSTSDPEVYIYHLELSHPPSPVWKDYFKRYLSSMTASIKGPFLIFESDREKLDQANAHIKEAIQNANQSFLATKKGLIDLLKKQAKERMSEAESQKQKLEAEQRRWKSMGNS